MPFGNLGSLEKLWGSVRGQKSHSLKIVRSLQVPFTEWYDFISETDQGDSSKITRFEDASEAIEKIVVKLGIFERHESDGKPIAKRKLRNIIENPKE